MDQQLQQEESEQQAEAQGSHSHSQQSPENSAAIFRDSKSMKTHIQSGVHKFNDFTYKICCVCFLQLW